MRIHCEILLSILVVCAACATRKPTTEGAAASLLDGHDCSSAIVITATAEREGIAAEYRWLAERYPNGHLVEQSLSSCGERPVDKMKIETAEGDSKTVYFDISAFFGK